MALGASMCATRISRKVLKTTPREERLIRELTSRSVSERLKAGEVEIVDDIDWSDVPELLPPYTLMLPKKLIRDLEVASRKQHTTPRRLAVKLLKERLGMKTG